MKKDVHPQPLSGGQPAARLFAEAHRLYQAGRLPDAEATLHRLLAMDQPAADACFLMGLIALRRGDKAKAEPWFRRCVKADPHHVAAQTNLGNLLRERGRVTAALTCYRAALENEPQKPDCHYNLANCLRDLGRRDEAYAALWRALELDDGHLPAGLQLMALLRQDGSHDQAANLGITLIARRPDQVEPRLNLGEIYRLQGRFPEAREMLESALALQPDHRPALLALATVLMHLGELERAEVLIRRTLSGGQVALPQSLALIAHIRARQENYAEAIHFMSLAVAAGAIAIENYLLLAFWCGVVRDRVKAIEVLEHGLARHGGQNPSLLVALFYNQLCLCDWRYYESRLAQVRAFLTSASPPFVQPFITLLVPGLTPVQLRQAIRPYTQRFANMVQPLPPPAPDRHSARLRLGYLSSDFYQHPTAYLTAEVFEHHDRQRFEVHAYAFGPDDGSPTRRRLEAAFEHFTDISALDSSSVAQRIREDGIDILIDLKGYTLGARSEILALRPAPLQVNWLGYPGTMAVDFMDYIVVDSTLVPITDAGAYQEALAYLPDSYAPLDRRRTPASRPSRIQAGLPETGFVFCCFNNPRKIIPEFFHCWCRLLATTPGSVLWLYTDQAPVSDHLRREAAQQGIAPERLLFAASVPHEEHLARLPLADLILDTLPYNAHTTTADALFMGVPVLTCLGNTFAGRVAASLLRSAGLPELVTHNLEDYETLGQRLTRHPHELAALRQRLVAAADTQSYFDMPGFTRRLEELFLRMWDRRRQGLAPALLAAAPKQAT